jgi:hypothetical protein
MFPTYPAGAVSAGSVAGCGTGSAIGANDSTTGTSCTGSAIGAGDSTTGTSCTGSAIGAGDGLDPHSCLLLTLSQRGEKFPGPHTYCAEAGGAAAR